MSAPAPSGAPLWVPGAERVAATPMAAFAARAAELHGIEAHDPVALHDWSVRRPEQFWPLLFDEMLDGVERRGPLHGPGPDDPAAAIGSTSWWPEVRLNVAEQILCGRVGGAAAAADDIVVVAVDERGRRLQVTRAGARAEVACVANALRAEGVGRGDRVAAWMPNTWTTMVVMLAAASIGAVFSSTSPDFGVDGVLDRFGQIEPSVLVAADGYTYGGRPFDRRAELARVMEGLPSLRRTLVVGFLEDEPDLSPLEGAGPVQDYRLWSAPFHGTEERFEQLPFDHPWYVLYSSGTTGVPKCIVHRAGGVLLQHLKEHRLHCDIRPGDRVFYFTTCGWMMWNWLASVPASGATAVLYEGNPFHPGAPRLWELVEAEGLTLLGVSARYLDEVRRSGHRPAASADLSSLRTLASTGSPLSPEAFEWIYDEVSPGAAPGGLHLASISGGTDICGCFVGGDPTRPVFAGEIQGPALGMAVDVWDEDGAPAGVGQRGELVCTEPFPSAPLGFWGDGPLGSVGPRYRSAYFERFEGVWAHGDFATWTEHGGMVIHGRSDTTLNPGGVRIGTAEIYRQVEQVPGVVESLVFGREQDGDVRIVLLVRLDGTVSLDEEMESDIRMRIRTACTPRHVPSEILEVVDLPRTRSGKLAELAVADRVNGREVRNTSALANPESLDGIAALFD